MTFQPKLMSARPRVSANLTTPTLQQFTSQQPQQPSSPNQKPKKPKKSAISIALQGQF